METNRRFFFYVLTLLMATACFGCAEKRTTQMLRVMSTPPDAMCSVHNQKEDSISSPVMVAGVTPAEFLVNFYGAEEMWLKVEKRGYQPFIRKIVPGETAPIPAELIRNNGEDCDSKKESGPVKKIVVMAPDMDVILRGSIENESPESELLKVSNILGEKLKTNISTAVPVVLIDSETSQEKPFAAAWRDGRTAMEIVDPIRLKYLMCAPKLETSSGRRVAKEIGEKYQADAILLVSGRVDKEQGSLVASKLGLHVLGTANSFASGYSRALSSHQSTFVYTVYLPAFTHGTSLKAILVDCRSGEILWVNKGIFGIVEFTDNAVVEKLAEDLLTGLPVK